MLGAGEIFTLFFVTLGPLKVLGPFANRTRDVDDRRAREIAWWAFVVATIGATVGSFVGSALLDKWHVSVPAVTLTSGIIFFLVALKQLMEQYEPACAVPPEPLPAAPIAAACRIFFPIVLTPYGIAAVIALLSASTGAARTTMILGLLVLVMALDFLAMWFARRILVGVAMIVLQVVGAVLAVLQVALSVQFILVGLRSLAALVNSQ
jgi:multiple antibiotic resistance protein